MIMMMMMPPPLDVVFLKDQVLVHCFSCYRDVRIKLGFMSLQTTLTFCMRTKN